MTLGMRDGCGLMLIMGKNNFGRTSCVVLLEEFLPKANPTFSFNDFPVSKSVDTPE